MSDRARILLVDDRVENLLALEAILAPLDLVLVRATSGEDALRALLKEDFALILLDAHMPGMDGYETATRIKRRSRTRNVPIIFLTAFHDDPNSTYQGYMAGGADYLAKPFDPWILRAKVQVFVDLWEAGRGAAAGGPSGTDGRPALVGSVEERVAEVDRAVAELAAELADDGAATPMALHVLEQRVKALRQAVDGRGGR